ncbi:MAG: hypothetical protein FJX66_13095, partial [Alphaproteobacteria bacterium]|nr:hypothetical protein [Alphaproteobacteria bacterium]
MGRVRVPRVSAAPGGAWRVRRSEGAHHHPQSTLKKTACGCCGRVHGGWYDRRTRRVRDLACGDTRIFLELEVRRVR